MISISQTAKNKKLHRQYSEAELVLESTYKQMVTLRDKVKGYGDDKIYFIMKDITDDIEFHMKTCKYNKEIIKDTIDL